MHHVPLQRPILLPPFRATCGHDMYNSYSFEACCGERTLCLSAGGGWKSHVCDKSEQVFWFVFVTTPSSLESRPSTGTWLGRASAQVDLEY